MGFSLCRSCQDAQLWSTATVPPIPLPHDDAAWAEDRRRNSGGYTSNIWHISNIYIYIYVYIYIYIYPIYIYIHIYIYIPCKYILYKCVYWEHGFVTLFKNWGFLPVMAIWNEEKHRETLDFGVLEHPKFRSTYIGPTLWLFNIAMENGWKWSIYRWLPY